MKYLYKSPIYPALMVRLPGEGRRSLKAAGGEFRVDESDVEAFDAFIEQRPHYQIMKVGQEPEPAKYAEVRRPGPAYEAGAVVIPEPISASEQNPELAQLEMIDNMTVEQMRSALGEKGLDTSGRKPDLRARLVAALESESGTDLDGDQDPAPPAADVADESADAEAAGLSEGSSEAPEAPEA